MIDGLGNGFLVVKPSASADVSIVHLVNQTLERTHRCRPQGFLGVSC